MLAFDESLEILPAPFLIMERVDGTNLESLESFPPNPQAAWRALGEDLARIHLSRAAAPPGEPWPDERRDPRVLVELCAEQGWLSPFEARRLHAWLDRLAPLVTPFPEVFMHGDMQTANGTLMELAADPSRWARVAWYPGAHTAAAMAARLKAVLVSAPDGDWDFEARSDDGGSGLWAMSRRRSFGDRTAEIAS